MANLEKSYSYASAKFGNIYIGQFDYSINLSKIGPGGWSQIDKSSSYNIIDITSVFNGAGYIPFTASVAVSMMLTGGLRENDIAWSTNKESFNNAISWLWGDLEGGGVGLVKFSDTTTDYCVFVESHGIFYDEENDYEKIGFIANSPIYKNQVDAVAFNFEYHWERDYYIDGENTIHAFARKSNGGDINYKIYTNTLGAGGYSDLVGTQALGVALNNRWSGTFLDDLLHSYPYILIEPNSITCPTTVDIVVFHQVYDFNFGSDYIQEGSIYPEESAEDETNKNGGTTTAGGGGGSFDTSSDGSNRVTDSQFSIDAINSGFVSVYMPTQNNVQAFSDFLFTGITEDLSIVLKRLISSPLDYVVSLNMVHYTPSTSGSEEIKFCGISSGVSAPRVNKQFTILDCGSVDIAEQFSTFMDYSGHSRFKIYLPYCGIYPLEANDIMGACAKNGGRLSLQYIIDNLTGSCVAQLYVTRYRSYVGSENESFIDDRLMYEFTGNVFEQVPLSAVDYRGTIQGLMQIASGVSAVASGQSSGLGAVASGVMNLAPDVIHSGNASTSYGYMGVQTPFIFLERQIQNLPNNFQTREGYTSNIYVSKLNDVTGYTEIDVESFHTEYINCTDAERDEIVRLLSGGFII